MTVGFSVVVVVVGCRLVCLFVCLSVGRFGRCRFVGFNMSVSLSFGIWCLFVSVSWFVPFIYGLLLFGSFVWLWLGGLFRFVGGGGVTGQMKQYRFVTSGSFDLGRLVVRFRFVGLFVSVPFSSVIRDHGTAFSDLFRFPVVGFWWVGGSSGQVGRWLSVCCLFGGGVLSVVVDFGRVQSGGGGTRPVVVGGGGGCLFVRLSVVLISDRI